MKISWILMGVGFVFLTLSGCCFDPCVGLPMNGNACFELSSDTMSTSGFTRAEERSVYAVRYRDGRLTQPWDTLRQAKAPPAIPPSSPLLIYKRQFGLYFPGDSSSGHALYYRIVVPAANRHFDLRQVSFETKNEKSCNCQYVTNLHFTLDGQATTVPQARPEQFVIVLRK